jgi:uncharacterized membrane protein YidH (DUF202 family)
MTSIYQMAILVIALFTMLTMLASVVNDRTPSRSIHKRRVQQIGTSWLYAAIGAIALGGVAVILDLAGLADRILAWLA